MKNFFYSQFVENKRNLQFFKNFSKNFFRKSFVVQKLAVPLHSLSTSNAHYGKRDESETILENIPYRHSSTAVFFLLSARQEDCSNKKVYRNKKYEPSKIVFANLYIRLNPVSIKQTIRFLNEATKIKFYNEEFDPGSG